MNKVKLKYCFKCFLFWFISFSCFMLPLFFLFIIVAKIYQRPFEAYMLFPLICILLFTFLLSAIYILKFLINVKKQEEKYNVVFNDNNKKKVLRLTYISDEWIIETITMTVVYRKSIVHITSEWKNARGIKIYVANLYTDIKKYQVIVNSETNLEKIENWAKNRN